MTPTIDFTTIEQIRAWLAELPCPDCVPSWEDSQDTQVCQHGVACDVHCCVCHSGFEFSTTEHVETCGHCPRCEDTNRAYPWASLPCAGYRNELGGPPVQHAKSCICGGSGRVPKALTIDDLFEHGLSSVCVNSPDGCSCEYVAEASGTPGCGETPLLAALRAVAKQAGMPL